MCTWQLQAWAVTERCRGGGTWDVSPLTRSSLPMRGPQERVLGRARGNLKKLWKLFSIF